MSMSGLYQIDNKGTMLHTNQEKHERKKFN